MERSSWERRASILVTVCLGAALLYLGLRYLLPLCLPFLFAWGISLLVRPLSARLSERVGGSVAVWAGILLPLLLGGILFLLGFSLRRLVGELEHLLERVLSEGGGIAEFVGSDPDYFELLRSKIGFLRHLDASDRLRTGFNNVVENALNGLLTSLTSGIPRFVSKVVSAVPSLLFVTLITVIAGFYFCVDGARVGQGLTGVLPSPIRARIPAWKQRAQKLSWSYVRAYLLLLLLTFAELFLGFCILGVDYAFLLAALVALVDLLPILGVGTVLVPWSVIMLIQHRFFVGFGLLALFLAVTVVRQLVEPRLVGKSLGLHPLLTLFSTYVGWELFGFLGMLLGPFFALLGKALFAQYKK
ncbi:MAG: sporulation integral membrane protein YtvI [Clostridia bacterium]|nr:sporulation integral membrane protein YtvI [Clostridia bacterium]